MNSGPGLFKRSQGIPIFNQSTSGGTGLYKKSSNREFMEEFHKIFYNKEKEENKTKSNDI